jgi:C4-dicarboxylate-specific signal transduction histidine kinase
LGKWRFFLSIHSHSCGRQDAVNAMLLSEFQRHKQVEAEQESIGQLKSEMATLAAQLKEQSAQIRRISTQVQLNRPAPQTAANSE